MTNKGLIVGISSVAGRPLSELLISNGWTVYGTSRKEKPFLNERINVITCDLLNLEDSQSKLSKVINEITHLFFCSWMPGSTEEEELDLNTQLFSNILQIFDGSTSLKHVYLQTGTKYYGVTLGPEKGYKTPAREDDPRLDFPMFYYKQEDLLKEKARQNNWTWSVARPDAIIGFTLGTAMNLATTIALYAVLCKEEGKALIFPSQNTYDKMAQFCDSKLLSRVIYWMSTEDHAKNQAFNVDNGDNPRWNELWPSIAQYFGMEVEVSKEPINLKNFFNEREELWNKIKKENGLGENTLKDLTTPEFMEFNTHLNWDLNTSLEKLRSFGFTEQIDSSKMFKDVFDFMSKEKIIPSFSNE